MFILSLTSLNVNISKIGHSTAGLFFLKGTWEPWPLLWHLWCFAVGMTYSHPWVWGLGRNCILSYITCQSDFNFIMSIIYLSPSPYHPFQLTSFKNMGTVWEPTYSQEQIKLLLSYLRVFTTSRETMLL